MNLRQWRIIVVTVTFMLLAGSWGIGVAPVSAADYPTKAITLIIPTNAGGGYDLGARNVARFLPNHLSNKVSILPQNMSGGGK